MSRSTGSPDLPYPLPQASQIGVDLTHHCPDWRRVQRLFFSDHPMSPITRSRRALGTPLPPMAQLGFQSTYAIRSQSIPFLRGLDASAACLAYGSEVSS